MYLLVVPSVPQETGNVRKKSRFHCFLAETMEAAFRSLIRQRP
jgi:hypothetical protein